jgi:DNA-binding NarL/FixJ family response regulator
MLFGIGTKVVSGGFGPGNVTLDVLNGGLYLLCGMVVRARRPGQPIGTILVLASMAWFSEDLVTAYTPVLYYPGRLLANAFDPFLFQLLLGYPTGRLGTAWARAAVTAAWIVSLGVCLLTGVIGVGRLDAPINDVEDILASVLAVAVAAVLVYRYRRATPAARARLVVFTCSAVVVSIAYATDAVGHAFHLDGAAYLATSTTATVAVLLFPICVLLSFVRADLLRGRLAGVALGRLGPSELALELRGLLGDPSLQILEQRDTAEMVGITAGRQASTALLRDGRAVGALLHDCALSAEPEVLSLTAGLALDALSRRDTASDPSSTQAVARLSLREREVLKLMAGGLGNAAIGRRLRVSERTVEKHVAAIFSAFELPPDAYFNRRVAAVVGWLQSGEHPD